MKMKQRVNYATTIFFANSSILIGVGASVQQFLIWCGLYALAVLLTTPDSLSGKYIYLNSLERIRIVSFVFLLMSVFATFKSITDGNTFYIAMAIDCFAVFATHTVLTASLVNATRSKNPILG